MWRVKRTLINLYNVFVFPKLMYCVVAWNNALCIVCNHFLNDKIRLLHQLYQHHANTGIIRLQIWRKRRLLMRKLSDRNVPEPLHIQYFHSMKWVYL